MEQFPEQPTCINLNCERPVVYSHTKKSGAKRWRPVCGRCHMASYGAKPLDEGIVEIKKTYCENIDGRLKKNRTRLEAEKRKADREEPLGEFFKSCLSPEEKKKQEMEKDKMIDYE